MTESWARLGIGPLPLLAPSFRIFGDTPSRIWALGYAPGSSRLRPLDDRWVVDTTDVLAHVEIGIGDALSWIGDYEGGPGLYLWPPSRVISAEHVNAGKRSRIRSLRDSWLEPLRIQSVDNSLVGMSWKKAWALKQAIPVSRVCMQWWGLDVWCPRCGDLGYPTSFGLQAPPQLHDSSHIQEWGEFHTSIGSCVEIPEGAMQCPRCEWQWGDFAINSSADSWEEGDQGNFWPANATITGDLVMAYSLSDLLNLFQVADFKMLIEEVDSYTEPDTYVFESPSGLEIRVSGRGIFLDYPMSVRDIYNCIDELEAEYEKECDE